MSRLVAEYAIAYASAPVADIDVRALHPQNAPCSRIRVLGDGDLIVEPSSRLAGQSAGDGVTYAGLLSGDEVRISAVRIDKDSTCFPLVIEWEP